MSIIIQRKKFLQTGSKETSEKAIQHQKIDSIDQAYLKLFDDFCQGFQKYQGEANFPSLKLVCDRFYRKLKSNNNLLTDLAKLGKLQANSQENFSLLRKSMETVNSLSDHLLRKENLATFLNNPSIKKSPEKFDKFAYEYREIIFRCLKVLKIFTILNSCFALNLSNKPSFSTKLLELTLYNPKIYFKQTLTILEALMATNPATIPSTVYPLLIELLSTLPKKFYARFSRIIALMVLEPTDKIIFQELSSQFVESRLVKVHSFLLSIPNFVEDYTYILDQTVQVMNILMFANTDNIQKIINELQGSRMLKDSGLGVKILKPLIEQSNLSDVVATEILNPKFITKMIVKKSSITEILFVLSNLLSSKRKIDVQNLLSEIGFFPRVLNPLFDILFHPCLEADSPSGSIYDDNSYATNPLTTTRIQLLRIIINFSDRDSSNVVNKENFVSKEEMTVINELIFEPALKVHTPHYQSPLSPLSGKELTKAIETMNLEPCDPENIFFTEERMKINHFENVKDKGLMHKIILLLSKMSPNSSYFFWLSSCIESFLRGFHIPHQAFVAHTGLLYQVVKQIAMSEIKRPNNVQISYDLLGEIVKFNKHNIIFLESLCNKYSWLEPLATHAVNNVVDSNVFFRSLWLSFEKFDSQYLTKKAAFPDLEAENFEEASKLCQTIKRDSIKWFNLLVEAVKPSLISQDNICCVNTSLILAIFAEQKGTLGNYVDSLFQNQSNNNVLENFKNVLLIWNRYYTLKTKDSFSLQYTSSLPFYCFKEMREKLQTLLEKRDKAQ